MGQLISCLRCLKVQPSGKNTDDQSPKNNSGQQINSSSQEEDDENDVQRIPIPYMTALKNHPQFKLLAPLGEGGYGFVAKARDLLSGEKVAIKFIDVRNLKRQSNSQRKQTMKTRIQREIKYHQRISGHRNIVEFKCMFITRQYLCIVMEFAKGGNLLAYLNTHIKQQKKIPENEVRKWFQQLIFGIHRIQDEKIVNRDLKLENMLIQIENGEKVLKLCDFGFAKHVDMDSRAVTKAGSQPYMAPEVFFPEDFRNYDTFQRDIWSCGVVLYTLFYQQFPFQLKNQRNYLIYMQDVRWARFKFPENIEISQQAKDLINKMLTPNPQARLTLKQVMKHPWFKQNLPQIPQIKKNNSAKLQPEEEIDQLVEDIFNNKGSLNKYRYSLVKGGGPQNGNLEQSDEVDDMFLEPSPTSEMIDYEIDIAG